MYGPYVFTALTYGCRNEMHGVWALSKTLQRKDLDETLTRGKDALPDINRTQAAESAQNAVFCP